MDQHPHRQGARNRNPRNHFRQFNLAPAGLGIGGNGYRSGADVEQYHGSIRSRCWAAAWLHSPSLDRSYAAIEVVIARNGLPVARLTALPGPERPRRLGVARGQFTVPESIDAANPLIAELFEQA